MLLAIGVMIQTHQHVNVRLVWGWQAENWYNVQIPCDHKAMT